MRPPSPSSSRAPASRSPTCARAACTRRSLPDAARELALAGRVPTVLEHNCSGNHALMLLREAMLGRDPGAYLDPDGPAQADATAAVALACDCEPVVAGDRCGMRAYSVPLRNAALATCGWPATACRSPTRRPRVGWRAPCARRPRWWPGPARSTRSRTRSRASWRSAARSASSAAQSAETGRGGALKIEDGALRGHGDRGSEPARSGRGPGRRAVRPVAGTAHPATATARRSARGAAHSRSDGGRRYSPAANPPLTAVFPLLVENCQRFSVGSESRYLRSLPVTYAARHLALRMGWQGECRQVTLARCGRGAIRTGRCGMGAHEMLTVESRCPISKSCAPRRGRPGEGLLNVRRDRGRARRGRDLEGAGRGLARLPARPRHRGRRERRRSDAGGAGREKAPELDLTVEPSLDSLRLYLREIGQVSLLTAEQEVSSPSASSAAT